MTELTELITLTNQYCPNCETEVLATIIEKQETYNVLGIDEITIIASVCVCSACQCEIWNNDLDDQNLMKAYRIFAENHPKINFKAKKYL